MKPSLECQQNLCKELSRARTLHFAHTELQQKPLEQQAEFLEMERCKLYELVDCYIQHLALERPEQHEQPDKKKERRWWLEGNLKYMAVSGEL
jgi:hypothetical protein